LECRFPVRSPHHDHYDVVTNGEHPYPVYDIHTQNAKPGNSLILYPGQVPLCHFLVSFKIHLLNPVISHHAKETDEGPKFFASSLVKDL
ncbi:hypothetical protein Q6280_27290, partial [Klebsiella pneumoniae]